MPRGVRTGLTPKESKFCDRIVAGDSGVTAARVAGYSGTNLSVVAAQLKKKPKIRLRIASLEVSARQGVVVPGQVLPPDVTVAIVSRTWMLTRLLEIQHGNRDSMALQALKMLGQEELNMFIERVAYRDPANEPTDDLLKFRAKLRKEQGLSA